MDCKDAERLALGKRLRTERKAVRLSQAALARRLGKPQSFVAKFELGDYALRVGEYVQVTDAIGVAPVLLLKDVFSGVVAEPGDGCLPQRMRLEEFFIVTRLLKADPFERLANLLPELPEQKPKTTAHRLTNAWLQGKV